MYDFTYGDFFNWAKNQPTVKSNYYSEVLSNKPLEQKFIAKGSHKVSSEKISSTYDKISEYTIYYPEDLLSSDNKFPLSSMKNIFNNISSEKLTVMARRTNTDHGEMLANADSYMTAWFMYILKGSTDAKQIFLEKTPKYLQIKIGLT